jgi:hypothetical protein
MPDFHYLTVKYVTHGSFLTLFVVDCCDSVQCTGPGGAPQLLSVHKDVGQFDKLAITRTLMIE